MTHKRPAPFKLPHGLVAIIFSAAMIYALASAFTQSGLYAVVVSLQLEHFDEVNDDTTLLVTVVGCMVPAGLLLLGLNVVWPNPAGGSNHMYQSPTTRWAMQHQNIALGLVGSAVMLLVGVAMALLSSSETQPTAVQVAALEDGYTPETEYVELAGGRLDVDHAIAIEERDRRRVIRTIYFVPLFAEAQPKEAVVLVEDNGELIDALADEGDAHPPSGILEKNALSAVAKAVWETEGGVLPKQYWVLKHGRVPDDFGVIPFVLLALGLVGLVVAGVLAFRTSRTAPRATGS